MYWIIALVALSHVALIGVGLYCDYRPPLSQPLQRRLRGTITVNIIVFFMAQLALLFLAVDSALAQTPEAGMNASHVSLGMGLALIGIGIPTSIAAIGAGIAVARVGSAGMAVLAEKPEAFGRTLVYLGLAEGIAIYGLVVSILLLGKV